MQGKKKDVLRQIQVLFYLREFVVSSDLRSAPQTAKKPFFLESHYSQDSSEEARRAEMSCSSCDPQHLRFLQHSLYLPLIFSPQLLDFIACRPPPQEKEAEEEPEFWLAVSCPDSEVVPEACPKIKNEYFSNTRKFWTG